MKLLFIHADSMEYELKQPTKFAEKLEEGKPKSEKWGECLVIFTSVERDDAKSEEAVLEGALGAIRDVRQKVGTEQVVLYPYAHLSSSLGAPADAERILKSLEAKMREDGMAVSRSPFGWYKAFAVKCKGHPLSELSKQITAEEKKLTREDVVEGISSEHVILHPDGRDEKITLTKEWLDSHAELQGPVRKYIVSEELKIEGGVEPPSIKAMRRLELVDYEPASDSGNFRLYPKGTLMFHLLKDWADRVAQDRLGAVQIETPILYDWSQPDISAQGKSFHARHYMVTAGDDKREFVLRFAGDFGLFRIMRDSTMSYRQLPVRVYEFSKSFRYEQRGELAGLKRLRAFHMPDIHTFAADLEQGWEEYQALYRAYAAEIELWGIEYLNVFRVVREFYDKYKEKITELLKITGRPAFIEILSEAKHYWVIKNEFQGIDSTGRAYQLSTVQLDVEDAERYGIMYADREGKKRGCIITHSSVGSIERWIYGILEEALKKEKPFLPFCLAPTQVRLIPVGAEFTQDCIGIAKSLRARADVDDREEKLGRKIRDAETEWVSLIVVYGDKEKQSGKFAVRFRDGEQREMTIDELKSKISDMQRDFPFRPLAVPMTLSKNVVFRG